MFTPTHLTVVILNLLLPIFWFLIVLRDIRYYFRKKQELRDSMVRMDTLVESLEGPNDTDPPEIRSRYECVLAKHDLFKEQYKVNITMLKADAWLWIVLALAMAIGATAQSIIVAIKLYHKECPCEFRDRPAIEQTVPATNLLIAQEESTDDVP